MILSYVPSNKSQEDPSARKFGRDTKTFPSKTLRIGFVAYSIFMIIYFSVLIPIIISTLIESEVNTHDNFIAHFVETDNPLLNPEKWELTST